MRVVITGGNGYIGSRLSLFLTQQGHQVTAVCFPEIPKKKGWTDLIHKCIVVDLRNQESIKIISQIEAEVMIHLVSLDHYDSEKAPNLVSQVNIQPTWNLLNECTSKGLKKFIYFSTIHVYGKNLYDLIVEKQRPTPFNAYGLTHYLCEEICNYYNRKTETECINVRLSNSYGEPIFSDANCWDLIVNDLTRSAFNNQKIILKSDGSAIRDFIHFSNVCEGIDKLIFSSDTDNNNTIHFSSSKSVSMLDVAIKVRKVYLKRYKQEIPIYINGDEQWDGKRSAEAPVNTISNSLARSLSIEFNKELSSGIEDLLIYLEIEACLK